MKRRQFLQGTAAASAGAMLFPNIVKSKKDINFKPVNQTLNSENDNIMIIIELFGGNDGVNTIIPFDQEDEYMALRPTLNIPREAAVQYGDSELWMNKALVEGIHKNGMMGLLDNGRLAVVQGIGYDAPNMSHFRSRDIWHSGINSSDPNVKLLEGWLGRYFASQLVNYPLDIPEHPLAIHIGGTVPLLFKSELGHMGVAIRNPETFFELGQSLSPKEDLFPTPEKNYYEKEFNFVHVIAAQSEKYSQEVWNAYNSGKDKIKVNYSPGLAQRFRVISSLISGGLNTKVYHIRLSNFDSHAQQMQMDYTGAHATLLSELARGISEFIDDANQQGFGNRVCGLTISEFGRRAFDNGSRGTDHGAASMQFVFGGSDDNIEGGYFRVTGKPDLNDLDIHDNLKHQFDFRRTYTDFLETWLGATQEDTFSVFNDEYLPLGVLKSNETSVRNGYLEQYNRNAVNIYPNPSLGPVTIEFELKQNSNVVVEIFNLAGMKVANVFKGNLYAGYHKFNANLLNQGTHICVIRSNGAKYTQDFVILR